MKSLKFTKMHGAGNDYIYINMVDDCPSLFHDLAIAMSDRHKGVGADGLVVILDSEIADFKMRMYNPDGSESEMCGNASRCIGKYVYDKSLTQKRTITLETLSGIKVISLDVDDNNQVKSITVDMGEPVLVSAKAPFERSKHLITREIKTSCGVHCVTALSMGNPHGVVFVKDLTQVDIKRVGRELETHCIFPQKANIEFVQIINRNEAMVQVWERGCGETLACGTGACASLVASVILNKGDRQMTIHLPGGDLQVEWNEKSNHVLLTGDAVNVYEGEYKY